MARFLDVALSACLGVKGRLAAEGSEVIGNTHEQAMSTFQRDIEQWTEVIRRTGIKM